MKTILGFGTEEIPVPVESAAAPQKEKTPVRSLVSVRFINEGRVLTYYNDLFCLAAGDRVFVSGKLAGKPGIVEKVTTKFRINLLDYERVISKACGFFSGTFESVLDKMVSFDSIAMTGEEFRSWILPPRPLREDEESEILIGEGYELSLPRLEEHDEATREILDRAVEYCRSSKIAYISVVKGIGTAFVEGSHWYEVNFRLQGDMMTEMYCDCMYPGLCKHLLAVAITIWAMVQNGGLDTDRDFVAVDESRFWNMAAATAQRVTL